MTAPWASGRETYRCQLQRIDSLSYGLCLRVIGNPSLLLECADLPRTLVARHRHAQILLRMSNSASPSRIKPSSVATSA